jgi:glycosyltransferase involved in cell wall biosynthesis
MRILFICSADFRGPSEKQVLAFAQELLRRGNQVAISLAGDPATLASEQLHGLEGLKLIQRGRSGRGSKREADHIRRFAPSVIHAFNARLPVVAAAKRYAYVSMAPVLIHFEDDEWGLAQGRVSDSTARKTARRMARSVATVAPAVWPFATQSTMAFASLHARALDALTPALARHVEEKLGRSCRVILPCTPTLPEDGPPASISRGINNEKIICYTGAVYGSHLDDLMDAMRAIALVQRTGRAIRFVHAGQVADRFEPRRLAERAGLQENSYTFLGYRPMSEMPSLLASADVLVQPGRPTAFNCLRLPSKLQTYLASGTPVITFACGFGELLTDKRDALLFQRGAPDEIAAAVIALLDNEALYLRLSTGGPIAADALFGQQKNTDALLEYYGEAVSSGAA